MRDDKNFIYNGERNVQVLADLPAGRRTTYTFFVYVLQSEVRNYIYVGLTGNLERRVSEHQKGKERTTASYRPFILLFFECYPSREEARWREKYLKSGIGKEYIKNYAQVAKLADALP